MKKILINICLLLLSVAVGLLLCEIMVRIFSPQILLTYRDINRPDSVFIYRHWENADMMVDVGEEPVHFVTDYHGYRINHCGDKSNASAETDISILIIGDSFVEALSVENDQAIPELLAELLSEKHGRSVDAANAGHAGWTPNQYYLEARRSLALRHFDLGIVFLYAGNDCIEKIDTSFTPTRYFEPPRIRFPKKLNKEELKSSLYHPIEGFLGRRSHLSILLNYQLGLFLTKIALINRYQQRYQNLRTFLYSESNSTRWDVVTGICKGTKDEFERFNTPVFFVLLPADFQMYEELFYDDLEKFGIAIDSVDLEQPNKRLATTFEKDSLQLVGLLDHMRQKADEGIIMYSSISRHLKAQGNYIVAEYILPYAEEHLTHLLKGDSLGEHE